VVATVQLGGTRRTVPTLQRTLLNVQQPPYRGTLFSRPYRRDDEADKLADLGGGRMVDVTATDSITKKIDQINDLIGSRGGG
jgi:hypothetical protein